MHLLICSLIEETDNVVDDMDTDADDGDSEMDTFSELSEADDGNIDVGDVDDTVQHFSTNSKKLPGPPGM